MGQPVGRYCIPNVEAIQQLRAAKAWSIEKLADKAGLSWRNVQRILSGGEQCFLGTLERLALALDVPPSSISLGDAPPADPSTHPVGVGVQLRSAHEATDASIGPVMQAISDLITARPGAKGDVQFVSLSDGGFCLQLRVSKADLPALQSALALVASLFLAGQGQRQEQQQQVLTPPQRAPFEALVEATTLQWIDDAGATCEELWMTD